MKKAFSALVGNETLKSFFCEEILNDTLAHAYILEGETGIGKRTFARQLAAALMCENKNGASFDLPCGVCSSCRKVLAGHSADVQTVKRGDGKATMTVDVIRALRDDVTYAPNDGDYKVYIIEDADTMNVQAQNAFLLTLESPPPYVVFFLLCRDSGVLLETVRSRAPVRRMMPLDETTLAEYLDKTQPVGMRRLEVGERQALITRAGGCIGRALDELNGADGDGQDVRRLTVEALHLMTDGHNAKDAVVWMNGLVKNKALIVPFFQTLPSALRDLLLVKTSVDVRPLFFADMTEARRIAAFFTVGRLSDLLKLSEELNVRLEENANAKLVVSRFALESRML